MTSAWRRPDQEALAGVRGIDPSLVDEATGLPNRTHFDAVYGAVFHIGARGLPLTVVLLEVEDAALDTAGLARLGEAIRDLTRQSDFRARVGEQSVALLLLDCNVHGGHVVAERMLEGLSPWAVEVGAKVRAGVAAYGDGRKQPEALLQSVVAALEAARREGARIGFTS